MHDLFGAVEDSLLRPRDRQEDIPLSVCQKLHSFSSSPMTVTRAETMGLGLSWTASELSGLHRMLAEGLTLFRRVVVAFATDRQDP